MIALRDEADSAMAAFMGQVKGSLNLGGSTIPGAFGLPAIIGAFTARFPEVNVNLSIADTRQVIEAILGGDLEMGVVGAVSTNKSILQTHLVEDEMCPVVATDHRWSERKGSRQNSCIKSPLSSVSPDRGTLKSIQTSFSEAGLNFNELNVVARIGSTEAIRQGIKNRIGNFHISRPSRCPTISGGKIKNTAHRRPESQTGLLPHPPPPAKPLSLVPGLYRVHQQPDPDTASLTVPIGFLRIEATTHRSLHVHGRAQSHVNLMNS